MFLLLAGLLLGTVLVWALRAGRHGPTRMALLAGIVVGAIGLVTGLGIGGEALGDWTDAHPDRATLAWTLWNLGVLTLVGGGYAAWRRYRRGAQPRPRVEV